jgi:hypothetical protein
MVLGFLLVAFVAAVPFASVRLPEIDGFIPAIQAIMAAKEVVQISTRSAIFWSGVIVIGLVCAITWGLVAGDNFLPLLLLDRVTFAPLVFYVGLFDTVVCGFALLLLWTRQNSVLDQWLNDSRVCDSIGNDNGDFLSGWTLRRWVVFH